MAKFAPVVYRDGYLPIEDHGLIGDGATAALVGRDGGIWWMCIPRFDSPPLFASLLDRQHGGRMNLAPMGLKETRQTYLSDTGVLVTEMWSDSGLVGVTDALALRAGVDLGEDAEAGRQELIRRVVVLEGKVRMQLSVDLPRNTQIERAAHGLCLKSAEREDLDVHITGSIPIFELPATFDMSAGDQAWVMLRWSGGNYRRRTREPEETFEDTVQAWRRWINGFNYNGPQEAIVRRSAITLKLLNNVQNGAVIAAPTSSLPEVLGGSRNWDYRYAWIRDAAFSVYALHRIGFSSEAAGFLGWVLDAIDHSDRPRVLYDLNGKIPCEERIDPELSGYRGSRPVRWGNAAVSQVQHDIYGEILDCAYQWAKHHGSLDQRLWDRLTQLVDAAGRAWHSLDHGIWEVRTNARPFTYSAALCQVALDRGARLAARFSWSGDITRWTAVSNEIRDAIVEKAWNPELQSFAEHLDGSGGLDASLLSLPLRRVIEVNHPRMLATTEAIRRHLDAGNGLLYRYLPQESPDGLPGREGAFLLCSFWMVDNLAGQGRIDEALQLYDSLCARASPLGLFSEQIDPRTGSFLGNFPQAISHIGAISSGVNLARM
jgi:GH15 family glucan-1,4-alpha-glucosidase